MDIGESTNSADAQGDASPEAQAIARRLVEGMSDAEVAMALLAIGEDRDGFVRRLDEECDGGRS